MELEAVDGRRQRPSARSARRCGRRPEPSNGRCGRGSWAARSRPDESPERPSSAIYDL